MALFYPTPMAKYYWPYAVGGMCDMNRLDFLLFDTN